jgi:predicted Zn-dependent protease
VRARQGKTNEVVVALKTAYIDGRPENPAKYFEVARRLENWGMLQEARGFAEQGIQAASDDLLALSENESRAKTYVRIMTRLRQHEPACTILQKALADAASSLPVLKEQVARQGISGLTDEKWRNHMHEMRIQSARNSMTAALMEMGSAVNTYFTPEERLNFAHFAESLRAGMNAEDVDKFAIPLARSANLSEQEARWEFEVLMHEPNALGNYSLQRSLVELQRRRTRFAELAKQMEQFAGAVRPEGRNTPLLAAADAYRSAGDEPNEMRVLASISAFGLDDSHQDRLYQLQLARAPLELIKTSAVWKHPAGEKAANFVVAHGESTLAHSVVRERGKEQSPVWTKAYNALVGLYFAEPTPEINNSFIGALGDGTIGRRLAKPADRQQELAGNNWFYYGSRYGEYLSISKLGNPDDFLPAILEESPASSSGYLTLADYYAGAGKNKAAIADYEHTLELSPNRPDVYGSLAVAYYKQGNRTAALAQWKQAFASLSTQLNGARLPETFWADFGRTCDQMRTRQLFNELKPDADTLLRIYLRRNGNYRSNALLHPAYLAVGDASTATTWLLDVTSAAHDPTAILVDLVNMSWIPLAQRAPIYQRILQNKQDALSRLNGLERAYAEQDLATWQVNWIRYLVRAQQYAAAADAIAALPKETREAQAAAFVPPDLQVAAHLGTLDARIAQYRAEPQSAPPSAVLRAAARALLDAGDKSSARKILEFVFAREIDDHQLVAANFLGLAEIRLASGDTAGAVDLLRRLVVVVGNPFENLDPAAALLEKAAHNAEAVEFLDQLVKSSPWNPSYRLRLAKAKMAAGRDTTAAQDALAAVARGTTAAYDVRIQAALALSGRAHGELGSGELDLLASASMGPVAADKFYFYEARIEAARHSDTATKVQLLSHCVIDFPDRNEARIPLFESEVSAQSYEQSLGTLEPLLQAEFLRGSLSAPRSEEDSLRSEAAQDETNDEVSVTNEVSGQILVPQRAKIARAVGDTMLRLNRLDDALAYLESARRFEMSAPMRQELRAKITDVKAALRTQRENAARQPLLHAALEQDRMVRPRLMARSGHGTKVTGRRGVQP